MMTFQGTQQHESPTDPCDECPSELDKVACRAEGVKAQNVYNELKAADLKKAREDYKKARAAYSAARTEVWQKVQDARAKHEQSLQQLECLIKDSPIVTCLKDAHEWVMGRLAACPGGTAGCCMPDGENCEFDTGCDRTAEAIAGRIAAFADRVAVAELCFVDLIKEPDALKTRVAELVKEIDAIVTALKVDQVRVDYRRLYARALIAGQALDDVWHGFADVNAYITCLCRALTCMIKGHGALGELKGAQAELECWRKAKDECCKNLRLNILEEVMAYFLKKCGQTGEGDQGGKPGAC